MLGGYKMAAFNTIEEALEDLRRGKIILVTDDEDRENEGDFICAAQFATTENINFMATHGKGLICMPMSEEYVEKLKLPQMVENNTDNHECGLCCEIMREDGTMMRTEELSKLAQQYQMKFITIKDLQDYRKRNQI